MSPQKKLGKSTLTAAKGSGNVGSGGLINFIKLCEGQFDKKKAAKQSTADQDPHISGDETDSSDEAEAAHIKQPRTSEEHRQGLPVAKEKTEMEPEQDTGVFSGLQSPLEEKPDLPSAPISLQDQMKAIVEEFGPTDLLSNEPEEMMQAAPGALLGTVIIRGALFLTSKRIAFYAALSEDALAGNPAQDTEAAVGTLHFKSSLRPSVKCYLKLKSDSAVAYPSSKDLSKPFGTIHFSTITSVASQPGRTRDRFLDYEYIVRVNRQLKSTSGSIEFDDEEGAARWRSAFASAVFTFQNERSKFRFSIPLDRVISVEMQDWIGWVTTYRMKYISASGESAVLDFGALNETPFKQNDFRSNVERIRQRTGKDTKSTSKLVIEIDSTDADIRKTRSANEELSISKTRSRSNSVNSSDDADDDSSDEEEEEGATRVPTTTELERFRFTFGLMGKGEDIFFIVPAVLFRPLPISGKIGVSEKGVYFHRKTHLQKQYRVSLAAADIKGVEESSTMIVGMYSMSLKRFASGDVPVHFISKRRRDDTMAAICSLLKYHKESDVNGDEKSRKEQTPIAPLTKPSVMDAWDRHLRGTISHIAPRELLGRLPNAFGVDRPWKIGKLKFCCLMIGSRGDVQPYIALCQGLIAEGHHCIIATHAEYKDWVEENGIEHRTCGGDPSLLMDISVEHKIFDGDTIDKFRTWFDELLRDSYKACKDHGGVDVLIESPAAFAGIHIAEALNIPYIRSMPFPWTKTGDWPQPFIGGPADFNRAYNISTYAIFNTLLWRASSSQINKWRKHVLKIPKTDLDRLHQSAVPFVYSFSSVVVPRPLDWPTSTVVSGYWVMEESKKNYDPPEALAKFIKKARDDKKPLVYLGFGSITLNDPDALTKNVIESVKISGVRMILAKGWSGRRRKSTASHSPQHSATEMIPDDIYEIDSVPHDWLFSQIDATMTHGGAGTTAASLRHGLVTIIHPFFGDQGFWADRVKKLGAGLRLKSLDADDMAEAWKIATTDRVMKEKATLVGKKLQTETGVKTAINFIYRYLGKAQRGNQGSSGEEKDSDPTFHSSVLISARA